MSLPVVLFVDHDPSILIATVRAFRDDSVDIRATTSPCEALEIAGNEEVVVLVYDWLLPEMSGTELARQVRSIRPNVRLILSSDDGNVDGNVVFAVIPKPSAPARIRAAVSDAVESYSTRMET
jgi:DNA-binding NtrC family response regulator